MPMRVTVHYLAQMKRAAGCSAETVEMPPAARLQDLLAALAERHGEPFRTQLLDEANRPRKSLLFFVGEEHAELAHPLREGEAVSILAPMAGGSI